MASVVIVTNLPSVRIGLAQMLSEYQHTIVGADDEWTTDAVRVLDAPSAAALDALSGAGGALLAAVVLTDDPRVTARLQDAGLRGWACLGRDANATELDLAVRAADAGLVLMDVPVAAATLGQGEQQPGKPEATEGPLLSPRELEVLQMVAQGLPNKGIARALTISENTAKFHVASICAKLGAGTRTEAVTLAARRGLVLL